ncbi:RNase H domain-containing protein [Trichonephila clavipes]|nr:RNase H domain-containing protein [Trichonephila clavipes]
MESQLDNKLHSVKPVIGVWPVMPLRRTDVKLTRLRIGHTRFTHRHLLFGERAPECPLCHVSYTVHHILIDCPVFNNYRITFFNSSHLTLPDLLVRKTRSLRSSPPLTPTPPFATSVEDARLEGEDEEMESSPQNESQDQVVVPEVIKKPHIPPFFISPKGDWDSARIYLLQLKLDILIAKFARTFRTLCAVSSARGSVTLKLHAVVN